MALIFAGLNDREQAIHWLLQAYEDRSNWLVWLNLDPRFGNVRADPRFADLLRRMHFPGNYGIDRIHSVPGSLKRDTRKNLERLRRWPELVE
jgi:hypothetical protein